MANFPDLEHYKGDTFDEIHITYKVDGVAVDITNFIITIQLKKEVGGISYLTLSSIANAGITITSGINGIFKINKQIINVKEGNYIYDMEFNNNGIIDTFIKRASFKIIGDIANG